MAGPEQKKPRNQNRPALPKKSSTASFWSMSQGRKALTRKKVTSGRATRNRNLRRD